MKWIIGFLMLSSVTCIIAQSPALGGSDSFKRLSFLVGTRSAITPGGASGPNVAGSHTFKKELDGHILARHSSSASCKAPAAFDCDHGDLLYVYADGPQQELKAIYFDNEGHVIHYNVSTPTASSVIFLSDPLCQARNSGSLTN